MRVKSFLPLAPRISLSLPPNKLEATADDLSQLQTLMETVAPTIDAVRHWTSDHTHALPDGARCDPLLALFEVVRADTKAFVRALDVALEMIGKDSWTTT